jgi:hypothetical protein
MCCKKKVPPKHQTSLLTLDGVSYFPRDFVDFKQFHSTKAHAIGESDDEEDVPPIEKSKSDLDMHTAQKQGMPDDLPLARERTQFQLLADNNDFLLNKVGTRDPGSAGYALYRRDEESNAIEPIHVVLNINSFGHSHNEE